MRCSHLRSAGGPELSAGGPELDVPILDYIILITLLLACLAPLLLLR